MEFANEVPALVAINNHSITDFAKRFPTYWDVEFEQHPLSCNQVQVKCTVKDAEQLNGYILDKGTCLVLYYHIGEKAGAVSFQKSNPRLYSAIFQSLEVELRSA